MARSLPENTVDAWTCISLARQGANWIWLPTTNAGAASGGSHPADVSTLSQGRLLLIENKGIEDGRSIDLGKNSKQNDGLCALQDFGHKVVRQPWWIGWVFYGLPSAPGPRHGSLWNGWDFRHFEASHLLVCPHKLRGGKPVPLQGVRDSASRCSAGLCQSGNYELLPTTVSLDRLAILASLELLGLPLGLVVRHNNTIRQVGTGAPINEPSIATRDADEPINLLDVIQSIVDAVSGDGGTSTITAAVFG